MRERNRDEVIKLATSLLQPLSKGQTRLYGFDLKKLINMLADKYTWLDEADINNDTVLNNIRAGFK